MEQIPLGNRNSIQTDCGRDCCTMLASRGLHLFSARRAQTDGPEQKGILDSVRPRILHHVQTGIQQNPDSLGTKLLNDHDPVSVIRQANENCFARGSEHHSETGYAITLSGYSDRQPSDRGGGRIGSVEGNCRYFKF